MSVWHTDAGPRATLSCAHVIPEERRGEIEAEAEARAGVLDDAALCEETLRLMFAHADAPAGDEKEALKIQSQEHVIEMGRRLMGRAE